MSDKREKEKQALKIREFEWYQVQTKVRQIMVQLLQPFNKKQTEDTIKINEIKRNIATMTKKIEDHEFLLERPQANKPTYIQQQDDQIEEIRLFTRNSQIDNQTQITTMQTVVALYEQKIKQLNSLQQRLDAEITQRTQEYLAHKAVVDQAMNIHAKRMDTQVEQVNTFKNTVKSGLSKMDIKLVSFENKLKELEDRVRHQQANIKRVFQDSADHSQRINKLELKCADLGVRIDDREKDSKLSQKFLTKVKEMQNDMSFFTRFLEQYQPLYIQLHISESLHSFLEGRHRRKLCVYEEERFAKLHRHILENEHVSLEDMMARYTNQIKKIINRNKKYIIDLSVRQSIKYGTNLYEFRENPPEEQQPKTTTIVAQNTLPEEQVAAIVSKQLEQARQTLDLLAQQEIAPTRAWMKELQEQQILRAVQVDQHTQELKNKVMNLEAQLQLQFKNKRIQIQEMTAKQEQVNEQVIFFRQCIRDVLNFGSVVNHIVIQDQIDRQGTALYALRGSKGGQPGGAPVFQLDPNCQACQGKGAVSVQQAYKMACLTYNPSQIRIDQQLFSRQEILQISTSILQKLKKKLWVQPKKSEEINKRAQTHRRKSQSSIKDQSGLSRDSKDPKRKELQTLLPLLGTTQRRQPRLQHSIFY